VNSTSFLVKGGSIYTMDPRQPWAQCLVVRGNEIVYIGPETGSGPMTDDGTNVIDLDGGLCLPGFIDAHDHYGNLAMTKIGVDVTGLTNPDVIVARIRQFALDHPERPFIQGFGWANATFDGGSPTRTLLDQAVNDRPCVILSWHGHDGWFNTAAMRAAELTPDSPDPDPGIQYYPRDHKGWPTGHAVEPEAMIPILAAIGAVSYEGLRDAQRLTIDAAPSWGVTSYMEAGVILGPNEYAEFVYQDLVDRDNAGTIPIRIVGTVWSREASDDPAAVVATLKDWNHRIRSEHIKISVLKVWADGTFMSGGALLLEPLTDDPTQMDCGTMTFTKEQIERQTELAQLAGFDMHVHVDGDGSVRTVLDAFEAVRSRIGNEGSRHTICHNTLVHPVDVRRFAELGVIANCTPIWGTDYEGHQYDVYERRLGPERMEERLYPYGDLVRSGAVVTYGADLPGSQIHEIAPLMQIEAAVTRKRPGHRDDRALVERQRVDLHDALRGYTINGAFQLRLENEVGSLEVGKRADLTVWSRNLFDVDPDDIHTVPLVLTMMDGLLTYDARSATTEDD
jgi:predicted amidohydrolase YtcJ